jgi:hypothetical protein
MGSSDMSATEYIEALPLGWDLSVGNTLTLDEEKQACDLECQLRKVLFASQPYCLKNREAEPRSK